MTNHNGTATVDEDDTVLWAAGDLAENIVLQDRPLPLAWVNLAPEGRSDLQVAVRTRLSRCDTAR